MSETHQWTVPCSGCESPVEYNCTTCQLALCLECKEKHHDSEDTKNHPIVPYSERIKPTTQHCKRHPGNVCFAWCNMCICAVCKECVTASCHKKHDFVDFQEKIAEKRAILQSELDKSLELCFIWQGSISDLEKRQGTLEQSFDVLNSEIKTHAETFYHKAKQIEEKRSKQLRIHKQACLQTLSAEKRTLRDNLDRFEKERCEYENMLRSDDVVAILEFKPKQIRHDDKPYEIPIPRLPTFLAGELDDTHMERMFGNLAFKEVIHRGYSTSIKEKEPKRVYENIPPRPRYNSLPPSNTESHIIHTEWNAACPVVCIGHGQAWIATQKSVLKLIDKDGNSSGEKMLDFIFCDAVLTSSDNIMLLDNNENCVRQLSSNGRVSILFSLNLKPYRICPLHNDNIIITFREDRKVIKYRRSGVRLIEFHSLGLHRPWNLVQNKVNKHIYIIDKTGYGYYKDPGRVVICTENGEFLSEYKGRDNTVFTPVDVCSDKMGQMLITDYDNHRVHILNQNCRFLRFLEINGRTTLVNPCRIDINDSMYVWISENLTEKVKVVRYI